MINENNFLKIEYSLIIVQFLTVLLIFLIHDIPTVFYFLSFGISFIVFYIFKKNKKFKIEKIKNFKFHEKLISSLTLFLVFLVYLFFNWRN
jgi:O-antigen/teichoic acid export membrane protein